MAHYFCTVKADDMNWKVITWYIGVSLLLVAALMTISGVIA